MAILRDTTLSSRQAAKKLYMASATVRYHRIKLGVHTKARLVYGIVKRLALSADGAAVLRTPVKELAYIHGCSETAIKRVRALVKQGANDGQSE
jgi:hypothetical protein